MELVQSFLLSVTRVRLALYEQRILTKIVEHGQSAIKGLSSKQFKYVENPFSNEEIEIPIRYILADKSKDYAKVVNACKALMRRQFEFYEPTSKTYYSDTVIHNVKHVVGSGKVSFMVSKVLFNVMLDFSLGYKSYDLEKALSLPTPYAVRMYVLLNNQTTPLTWDIEKLKDMFGVSDKYKQTRDFIRKVIEPARQALVHNSCNGFTYSRVTEGRKVIALRFFPCKVKEEEAKTYEDIGKEAIINYKAIQTMLREDCGFTWKELHYNRETLTRFAQIINCADVLYTIETRAKKKRMDKGYIINAMKSEIKYAKEAMQSLRKIK